MLRLVMLVTTDAHNLYFQDTHLICVHTKPDHGDVQCMQRKPRPVQGNTLSHAVRAKLRCMCLHLDE